MKSMHGTAQKDRKNPTRNQNDHTNGSAGTIRLAISPQLAQAADRLISASKNHYSPAEGVFITRMAQKIARFNNIQVDPNATPLELLIMPGATAAPSRSRTLISSSLSALLFAVPHITVAYLMNSVGMRMCCRCTVRI